MKINKFLLIIKKKIANVGPSAIAQITQSDITDKLQYFVFISDLQLNSLP